MIKSLHIQGFKSISDQTLELGRVNCLIGANGTGKSNILEALGVLGAAANGVVDDESLLRRGVRAGLPRLYKSSFATERTPAHIALSATGEKGELYRVSLLNPLESPEPAWSYKTERLNDGSEDLVSDGIRNKKNLNPKAGLAALKKVEIPQDNPAADLMARLQEYAIYCPNTPTLRGIAQDMQSRSPVGLNGGSLADGFAELRRHFKNAEDDGPFEELLGLIDWVSDVQTTSQALNLLSPKVPRSKLMLKFTDRFMNANRNELTAYDASEGALYIIFCAILCLHPASPRFFAVDNLDQALNPRLVAGLVSRLLAWLKHNSYDRQMIFTAHNPAVLDGLDLLDQDIRLFTVERNSEGMTSIRRVELSPELLARNKEYPLSRLWIMGALGAVPNV